MTTSGTSAFQLTVPDLVLEAFDRLQVRLPALTLEHLVSARRSLGLVFSSRWSNRGVNLWAVAIDTIPLVQGVATYTLPADTIMVLDAYLRNFQMGAPVSFTPTFATSLNSPTITVTLANHGFTVGEYISVVVPVSIGGLILFGFYQVVSVPNNNTFTFTAASNATAGASGGTVPSFATTLGSAVVTVTLANHGLLAGQAFNVQVSTTVGGIILLGSYTVATVTSSSIFTITNAYVAGAAQSGVLENGGSAQIAGQVATADPIDRILYPISRTDYASQPDKTQQGSPTTFWFDRLTTPTITLWQVPDQNGPYAFQYYRQRQVQDANIVGGQTLDMPPRFFEAAAAELAAHLSWKYPPNPASGITVDKLEMAAKAAWAEAAAEDRERVTLSIMPDFSSYFS